MGHVKLCANGLEKIGLRDRTPRPGLGEGRRLGSHKPRFNAPPGFPKDPRPGAERGALHPARSRDADAMQRRQLGF